ncbi:MAG: DUF933 domain-containing protein [Clostridia bacterium]|nr:DUF933 domain-containing protein [Clostridia bacterium]
MSCLDLTYKSPGYSDCYRRSIASKGFIRAEVVPYEVLLECGNYNNAKADGKVRSEGKEYVMKDGDVVLFRFNV